MLFEREREIVYTFPAMQVLPGHPLADPMIEGGDPLPGRQALLLTEVLGLRSNGRKRSVFAKNLRSFYR